MIMLSYYLLLFAISLACTWWIFKKVLKIAVMKNIVDNPDARKLQRIPVPVLGGVAVFFGMIVALTATRLTHDTYSLFAVMGVMTIMLYVGTMDDIISLTPKARFIIEILVVLLLIYSNNYSLDDFHGLWNVEDVSHWISIPLTVFACVGIINAVNLIDGVNGLSSGYCIMACTVFGTAFYVSGDHDATSLASAAVGALIPFLCHNVFGRKSKMFIGDGGTLLMGTVLSAMVIGAVNNQSPLAAYVGPDFGVIPFVLAVLAIPVFDCLRVMLFRIIKGSSPFYPDRTHLHHLLFDMGFSHVGTSITEIMLNVIIIVVWWLSYRLGASIDMQLYIVVSLAMLFTFGFYGFVRFHEKKNTRLFQLMQAVGRKTHLGHKPWWQGFREFLDRNIDTE
jgi:UDP-N-acetylmuramyl pentapeptide phosphotransferase/UDP-N-acetylglucosamine-1-phosphate transferase